MIHGHGQGDDLQILEVSLCIVLGIALNVKIRALFLSILNKGFAFSEKLLTQYKLSHSSPS